MVTEPIEKKITDDIPDEERVEKDIADGELGVECSAPGPEPGEQRTDASEERGRPVAAPTEPSAPVAETELRECRDGRVADARSTENELIRRDLQVVSVAGVDTIEGSELAENEHYSAAEGEESEGAVVEAGVSESSEETGEGDNGEEEEEWHPRKRARDYQWR